MLITSAGQRVSLVRAFQRELRAKWPAGRVLAVDMNPELSPACHVADASFQISRATDPQFVSELRDLCLRERVGLVIPTIDAELPALAERAPEFRELGVTVVISSPGLVATCRDKRKTMEFFARAGVEVPRPVPKDALTFPVFIKPFDGRLSIDTCVVRDRSELLPRYMEDERFMFMEFLGKERYDEFTVDMYFDRHHALKCVVPRQRIFVRAGEINKGVTRRNSIIPFLRERFNRVEGAVGCMTLQLFLDRESGRKVGIEVNARFGGGYPLSYAAGANYPRWLLEEYGEGKAIECFEGWEADLLMLRYDDEVILHDYRRQT